MFLTCFNSFLKCCQVKDKIDAFPATNGWAIAQRERGDNGLFITLVPKVWNNVFLIYPGFKDKDQYRTCIKKGNWINRHLSSFIYGLKYICKQKRDIKQRVSFH